MMIHGELDPNTGTCVSNADVAWEGDYDGLSPKLAAGISPSDIVRSIGIDGLMGLLRDPDKFVVAHVLLTLSLVPSFDRFPDWNGLAVTLDAQGKTHIDSEQRHSLFERWRTSLAINDSDGILKEESNRS